MNNMFLTSGVDKTVIIIMIVATVISVALMIAIYIMRSKTLYGIAKRRGLPLYGMAWAPILFVWTLGGIADGYDAAHGMRRRWRWALLTLAVLGTVAYVLMYVFGIVTALRASTFSDAYHFTSEYDFIMMLLPMYAFMALGMLLVIACAACAGICQYKLYESCRPQAALRLLLVGLLVPYAAPFCLRSCLNWEAGVRCERQLPEVVGEPVPNWSGVAPWDDNADKNEPLEDDKLNK